MSNRLIKHFQKGKRMQFATKSFLGLCLICSTAGAVDPAAMPVTPSTVPQLRRLNQRLLLQL